MNASTKINPFEALMPPAPPNYINPPSLAPMLISVSIATVSTSLIFLLLRLWSRLRLVGKMEIDDWILIAAWLLSVFLSFSVSWSTIQFIGLHWWDIPPASLLAIPDFPGQYAAMVLYTLCTQLVKTAVLIFYMRLTPSRKFKIACWVVLVLITMGSIGTLPPIIFSCNPISTMWDPRLFFRVALTQIGLPDDTIDSFLSLIGGPTEDVSMRPKCLNFLMLWKSCAAINMAFDFVLLVMPLPVIYRSGIPWRQKVHVTFLFLLGVMVCIASVFRLTILIEAEQNFLDSSWIGAKIEAWTVTEVNLGLIVACLPNVRRLLSHYCPRYFNILPKQDSDTAYGEGDEETNSEGRRNRGHSYGVQLDSLQSNGSGGESKNHLVGMVEGEFTGYNQTRRLSGLSGTTSSEIHEQSPPESPVRPQPVQIDTSKLRVTEEMELERRIRRLRSTDVDLHQSRDIAEMPPMPVPV